MYLLHCRTPQAPNDSLLLSIAFAEEEYNLQKIIPLFGRDYEEVTNEIHAIIEEYEREYDDAGSEYEGAYIKMRRALDALGGKPGHLNEYDDMHPTLYTYLIKYFDHNGSEFIVMDGEEE